MTTGRTQHDDNVVIGSGEVYIDVYDDDGATGGERYLGDSITATLAVTTERTTIQSGDGPVARDLVDTVRSLSRTMSFTLRDSSIPNWALFLVGEEAEAATPTARVTGGSAWKFVAKKGRWFQIGAAPSRPGGAGAVTDKAAASKALGAHDAGALSVIVTSAAATPTSGNTIGRTGNYKVDKKAGRIYVEDAPADLVEGTAYYVHYQPADTDNPDAALTTARKVRQAKTSEATRQITCALRYIEDAAAGMGRSVYARKCTLAPGGDLGLKSRETEQQMAFTAAIQEPDGDWAAVTIDGEEV